MFKLVWSVDLQHNGYEEIYEKSFYKELAGRTLQVELGEWAQLANASAVIKYGDTVVVLSTATASAEPKAGIDFFPLSVDYERKMYSVGKFQEVS